MIRDKTRVLTKSILLILKPQESIFTPCFFPKKYNSFFEDILIEPIKTEAEKLRDKKYIINKTGMF